MPFKKKPSGPVTGDNGVVLTSCPVDTTLRVLGGKWKALILYQLRSGPKRFSALRRLLPTVTQRMLTAHLRELEADGIIERTIFPVIPPHVEYALTPLGLTVLPILTAMAEWGIAHAERLTRRPKAIDTFVPAPDAGRPLDGAGRPTSRSHDRDATASPRPGVTGVGRTTRASR